MGKNSKSEYRNPKQIQKAGKAGKRKSKPRVLHRFSDF